MEKTDKYLLWLTLLLFLLALILVGRGFIQPWLADDQVVLPETDFQLKEDVLSSPELADLTRFNHISYPDKEIGRRDLFDWPDLSEEDDQE